VIENIPVQSHFHFDIFLAMSENEDSHRDNWLSENYSTYVVLKAGTSLSKFTKDLDLLIDRYTGPQLKALVNQTMDEFKKSGGFIHNSLTSLTDIHLRSNKTGELDGNGSIQYVYIFTLIALFILVIACVNFMNLSTARSANRAKEVGVRKVLGSSRKNLVGQFLTESFLISIIALFFALLIAWLMLPYFNSLSGKEIQFATFFHRGCHCAAAARAFGSIARRQLPRFLSLGLPAN
jgi:putative ABC transport system permease protein